MEALSSLGSFFSSGAGKGLTTIAELGAAGAGEVGNLLNNRERNQELNYLKKQQAALQDPKQLAAMVKAATQPLDTGLVEAVGNQVSGTLAEQGLSQAPGIQATALSQALAPAELQEQQNALQLVMKRLGLPVEYAQTLLAGLPPNTNLAPLLALLQRNAAGGGGGGTPSDGVSALIKLIMSDKAPIPQNTTGTALPNTLQYPNVPPPNDELIFPPDTSSWLPPAISEAPPIAASFGG